MKKILIIGILGIATFTFATTLSRVHTGTFKGNQSRVLNNVIGEVETAVTAVEITWVVVDTNVTTTATSYTPAAVGQILTGGAGTGTNASWVAEGLTTNDWVQISSFVES